MPAESPACPGATPAPPHHPSASWRLPMFALCPCPSSEPTTAPRTRYNPDLGAGLPQGLEGPSVSAPGAPQGCLGPAFSARLGTTPALLLGKFPPWGLGAGACARHSHPSTRSGPGNRDLISYGTGGQPGTAPGPGSQHRGRRGRVLPARAPQAARGADRRLGSFLPGRPGPACFLGALRQGSGAPTTHRARNLGPQPSALPGVQESRA